jgi:hypothetical protein
MLEKGLYCKVMMILGVFLYASHICQAEIRITSQPSPRTLTLASVNDTAQIMIDRSDAKVVEIAAELLADDINEVTGQKPELVFAKSELSSNTVIIAGTLGKSSLVDSLIASGKVDVSAIEGKWEACIVATVDNISPSIKRAVVVVGSDRRGTAYGLMDISRAIGVSPWVWWADVKPEQKPSLYMAEGVHIETGPSVKFRGIFINDEIWGLAPWVKKTYEPKVGNFGPKTYAKIFELMLRLKANYIWPAMHFGTAPFYSYPENAHVAEDFAIVMGASHCEPMQRNNVPEWPAWAASQGKPKARFNYFTERDLVYGYWDARVKSIINYETLYTVGMRGITDGGMLGGGGMPEKVKKLEEVFADQREILTKRTGQHAEDIPQIFCPYKEVMYVYDAGLKVPDDVTICWAEDNQGYMRRLPNENERKRSGRHGLYYHLSYWSDYLWLSTFSPQLMSYELTKAAEYGIDKLWVFNVGDIKICEKEMEFAMDMAWDSNSWGPESANKWAADWAAKTFGTQYANEIGSVLNEFYRLAYRGKPEHIGHVKYSLPELEQRLQDYDLIAKSCDALRKKIPERLQDAFTHLIYYPVVACKYHNDKVLLARLSLHEAEKENLAEALALAERSKDAWEKVKSLTQEYNSTADGKWEHMMSWHPRDLKVFYMPPVAASEGAEKGQRVDIDVSTAVLERPMVVENGILYGVSPKMQKRSTGGKAVYEFIVKDSGKYHVYVEANTPSVTEDSFFLCFNDKNEILLNEQVTAGEWKWLKAGNIKLEAGKQKLTVSQREPNAKIRNISISPKELTHSLFANEPLEILTMKHIHQKGNGGGKRKLEFATGLSVDGIAVYSLPHLGESISEECLSDAPFIEFKTTLPEGERKLRVKCLPTHPVNKDRDLRYAISINGATPTIHNVEYKETFHNHHSCDWTLTLLEEPDVVGFIYNDHALNLADEQEVTLRISLLDPALVVHRVECF